MEEGYDIIIHNYQEQIGDDFLNEDELPGGVPVIIQLGKSVRQFHPLARRYVTTASTPMLAIVCGSVESSFAEFPGVRHKVDGTQDVFVDTPLQADLYSHLCGVMEQHNTSVQQLRNQAQAIKSVDGAVACGAMVRFFKAKAEHAGSGWLRAWSARGLDLVNGAPSNSMLTVERILSKIKDSGKKSKV